MTACDLKDHGIINYFEKGAIKETNLNVVFNDTHQIRLVSPHLQLVYQSQHKHTHKQVKEKEQEIRILILGLDNAGKTTMLRKFSGEPIDTIEPTLGFNIKTLFHQSYTLHLWDVGGQTSIRSYWRNYFEATDGLIWVVDSSDTLRLELCRQELVGLLQQERLAGASLLIFANKQDIAGALSKEEMSRVLELDTLSQDRHWSIISCSAVKGDGLVDGMDWMVEDIANRIFMMS